MSGHGARAAPIDGLRARTAACKVQRSPAPRARPLLFPRRAFTC